jgi:hypothetical protein
MNVRIGLAGTLVSIGVLGVFALYAGAQAPTADPQPAPPPPQTGGTVFIQNADGTIVEERIDGKSFRTTAPGRSPYAVVPWTTQHGGTVPVYSDPDSVKMASQEQATAQEARVLAELYARGESDAAKAEAKKKLREKLALIFDLQQQRRAHEIAKIEERLGKLKDTMKKRSDSKDPIIDRRLEQLTGGVDELGWEETGGFALDPNSPARYGYGEAGLAPQPRLTAPGKPVPGFPGGGAGLPSPVPVPPPTEPRR